MLKDPRFVGMKVYVEYGDFCINGVLKEMNDVYVIVEAADPESLQLIPWSAIEYVELLKETKKK